ncbi:MAG TPA: histidine kinase dimerization/phospho-acceptor domain-containing protein [Sphingomicrobium sp.]|nr:histidine kinase dimerization/phospho-acceptor domain-containing protein [Sphingomicrobium sp.]
MPRFDPGSGRFAGYIGLARREGTALPSATGSIAEAPVAPGLDSAALRELIHELRTPLTAIIGFGEIIEGQFLGPAHRAYRDRAGEIVRQARRLLGAVEELDLAAKLGSGGERAGGAEVAALMKSLEPSLSERLENRGATIRVKVRSGADRYAMDQALAERLVKRFAETVADTADKGERIDIVVDRVGPQIALALSRPRSASGLSEDDLFDPAVMIGSTSSTLDLGFTLRLVRGLAAIAGGSLEIAADRFVLMLPAAISPKA